MSSSNMEAEFRPIQTGVVVPTSNSRREPLAPLPFYPSFDQYHTVPHPPNILRPPCPLGPIGPLGSLEVLGSRTGVASSTSEGFVPPTCDICLQVCKIPVKFTCFPCFHRSKVHCHSIKRFCYGCAKNYLELNLRSMERSETKKCLYCEVTVKPPNIRSTECFEKDFYLMSLDTSRYNCINNGCQYTGTQNEINRHISSCDFTTRICRGCHQNILSKDMATHISQCEEHVRCRECREFIHKDGLNRHLLHQHSLRRCDYCEDVVPDNEYQDHLDDDCSFEPTQCDYCDTIYSFDDEVNHLCTHLEDFFKQDMEILLHSHDLRKKTSEIRQRISRL